MIQHGHSWGVTLLSQELGMPKSSTHRLLQTLIELGFIQKIESTRRYALSVDLFSFVNEIASNYGRNYNLASRLDEASQKIGCSVYLSMLGRRDSYVICGAGEEGTTSKLGSHRRAYSTSAGKILIAQLDESQWANYAPNPDEDPITPYTNRNTERFFAQLREVSITGIAWNHRESSKDHVSLATFVREPFIPTPRLAVALLMRYDELRLRDTLELETFLRSFAAELEQAMGVPKRSLSRRKLPQI